MATSSFPFELETECDSNVHVRGVHCSDRNSEISRENDQDCARWKEVQVLDSIILVLYNWMEKNKCFSWNNNSHIDTETKTYWPLLLLLSHNGVLCKNISYRSFYKNSLRQEILTALHDHVTGGLWSTPKPLRKWNGLSLVQLQTGHWQLVQKKLALLIKEPLSTSPLASLGWTWIKMYCCSLGLTVLSRDHVTWCSLRNGVAWHLTSPESNKLTKPTNE